MKRLFKKILSVLLAMLLTCSLVLPALTENAEGVICNDCADSIGLTENNACPDCDIAHEHLEEQENIGLMPDDEIALPPADSSSQPEEEELDFFFDLSDLQQELVQPQTATPFSISGAAPTQQQLATYNQYYAAEVEFEETAVRLSISADGKSITQGNQTLLTSPVQIDEAYAGSGMLFYRIDDTVYRLHTDTGLATAVEWIENAAYFYPESNNVVEWVVPKNPELYGLSVEEIFRLDDHDFTPFYRYAYDYTTGQTTLVPESVIRERAAAIEAAAVSEVASSSYKVNGVTIPFPGFLPDHNYFNNNATCTGNMQDDGFTTTPCSYHTTIIGTCRQYQSVVGEGPRWQCRGFGHYVFKMIEDQNPGSTHEQVFLNTVNCDDWDTIFKYVPIGSYIEESRQTNTGHKHAFILVAKDLVAKKITLYDCNAGNTCDIRLLTQNFHHFNITYDLVFYVSLNASHDCDLIKSSEGHYCTFKDCEEPGNSVAPHTYGGSFYPSGAAGHHQKCTVCGHAGPPTSHSYTQFVNITNTNHSLKCGVCSYIHSPNPHASVTYTSQSEYEHVVSCNACGLNVKPHVNETAYNSSVHFDKCSLCNYANVLTEEPHSLSYEITGTTHKGSCSGCSYTTANNNHTFSNWAPNGSTHHRKVCSLCGRAVTAAHTFGGWTSSTESRHFRYCSGCSYPNYANHNFSSWTDYSGTQHRRTCSACSRQETASHTITIHQIVGNTTHHRTNCNTCGYTALKAHSFNSAGICTKCKLNINFTPVLNLPSEPISS